MNDATLPRRDLAEVLLTLGACNETPQDAVPWARPYGSDWERALAECLNRKWFFWLAGVLLRCACLKREVLVATACACARSVLHLVPAGEDRPRLAVEAAERRMGGEATVMEVCAAGDAAFAAAYRTPRAATAEWAAARSARAAAHAAAYAREGAVDEAAADEAAAAAECALAEAAAEAAAASAICVVLRRELGPALLEGLDAYARSLKGSFR